jgi:hypothetical protein
MTTLICITLAIGALTSPTLSCAQVISVPLTRAQVYADLVRVEQAGYNPSAGDDANYPADIQAAERRVVAQNGVAQGDSNGYGPSFNGTSQQNRRTDMTVSTYSPPIYVRRKATGPAGPRAYTSGIAGNGNGSAGGPRRNTPTNVAYFEGQVPLSARICRSGERLRRASSPHAVRAPVVDG